MKQSPSGLWVPESFSIYKPSRRDVLQAALGAAGLFAVPKFLNAAVAFGSQVSAPGTVQSFPTVTLDTSSADLVVVAVDYTSGAGPGVTMSDSLGNTYNPLTAYAASGTTIQLWWSAITTRNASTVITASFIGRNMGLAAMCFSGTNNYAGQITTDAFNSTAWAFTGITTTGTAKLMIAAAGSATSVTSLTASGSWAGLYTTTGTDCHIGMWYLIQSVPGAAALTLTPNAINGGPGLMAAFSPSSAGTRRPPIRIIGG